MKRIITKGLLAIILMCSSLSVKAQATLYTENFDADSTALPSGWSTTGAWLIQTTNSSSAYTGASGNFNLAIKNTSATGSYDVISKSVSTIGYSSVTVLWGARLTTNFPTSGSIVQGFYWSSDNGTTWHNLVYTENTNNSIWSLDNGGTRISLPAGANNQASLKFKWTVNITTNPQGTYRIDDFTVNAVVTSGVNEIDNTDIYKAYVYNKTLYVQLTNQTLDTDELKIFTLTGSEVLSTTINNSVKEINLSQLTPGVYLLNIRMRNGSGTFSKKIMVN